MANCGRSICCSTFKSTKPGIPLTASCIFWPIVNIWFRSVPKILIAILASVPESIASIRCEIGWPISILAPVIVESFCRTSSITSERLRSFSSKGASISETFTPRACSSSSARPVLRATVLISGTSSNKASASRPNRSDSSREIPGKELTLIVNEPSLNGGKKLRPKLKKATKATTNRQTIDPNTARR